MIILSMDTASAKLSTKSLNTTAILFQAQRALAQGQYDEAVICLESAHHAVDTLQQADLKLHLSAVYALYRERGLDGALLCLSEAVQANPEIVKTPLYQALAWQLAACQGETLSRVRPGVAAALQSAQPLAQFHAASALIIAGGFRRATRMLQMLSGLPEHLEWRRWSLLGEAHAKHGDWQKARDFYARSVQLCRGADVQGELLSLAEALLHLTSPTEALALLKTLQLNDDLLGDDLRVRKVYLQGLTAMMLGQLSTGLEYFLTAYTLATQANQVSFDLLFQLARAFAACEQFQQAARTYEQALEKASKELRPFVLHAYGVTLAEIHQFAQSKGVLESVIADTNYSHREAACADLAEVYIQLNDLVKAQALATQALSSREGGAACLCLGKIALEYFHTDEAVVWFERAIADAVEGDDIWIAAHVLLADTLAQNQFSTPQRIHDYARKALNYLPSHDDWAIILKSYVVKAEQQFGGSGRLLN
jgi:tetratricopeptide (TPR) repeat protein